MESENGSSSGRFSHRRFFSQALGSRIKLADRLHGQTEIIRCLDNLRKSGLIVRFRGDSCSCI